MRRHGSILVLLTLGACSPGAAPGTAPEAPATESSPLTSIGDVSLDDQALPAPLITGQLAGLFDGSSQLIEDTSFVPPVIDGHAETSTVYFNGQYHMYFRAFHFLYDGQVLDNGSITGIGLALSDDGNTFTAQNSGLPLASLSSTPQATPTMASGTRVYAPSVIVDGTSLAMSYDINGGPASTAALGFATSTDGIAWTPQAPTPSIADDPTIEAIGMGESDLFKWNGEYNLTFCAANSSTSLARRWSTATTLDGLGQGEQVMNGQATPGWMAVGPGRASIIRDTDASGNSYFYAIFEGFKGSDLCNSATTSIGLGLARSTDLVHWTYSPANPLRLGRLGPKSCGDGDMPAWQLIAGQAPMVVATNIHYPVGGHMTVKRFKITGAPPGTSASPMVAMGATASGAGYWEVARNGGVFTLGDAKYHGSLPGLCATVPSVCSVDDIVAMAVTPSGGGYWLVGADGGVFAFGNASASLGSLPGRGIVPNKPIVGIAVTPSGGGYWLVGADGGVYAFGNASASLGSLPGRGIVPNKPIAGIARTPTGGGYWLAGGDGGVFAFGDASAKIGSLPGAGVVPTAPIVGVNATADGNGLWLVGSDGNVYPLGDANFFGTTGSTWNAASGTWDLKPGYVPSSHFQVAGMASVGAGAGTGYFLIAVDGGIINLGSAVYQGWVHGPGWDT